MAFKWDLRFIDLAKTVAAWSKDPDKQVGAIIVSPDRSKILPGYNGLPRGDYGEEYILADKELKLDLIIHAEENAILCAGQDLRGFTIYTWPLPPCARCASKISQAGIKRVVSFECGKESSWYNSCVVGHQILELTGVEVCWLNPAEIE